VLGPYTARMSNEDSNDDTVEDSEEDSEDHSDPIAVASYATAGEAEVAKAKLGAYGIEAALDDQIEGGTIVVDGEPGVIVEVKAADAEDAQRVLTEVDTLPIDPPTDPPTDP
jgi:hypothetical protein